MKLKTITELTNEELIKNEKTMKQMTIFMLIAIVLMLICGIIITFQKKSFNVFIILPVCFLPIYLNNFRMLKTYREEKTKRNL